MIIVGYYGLGKSSVCKKNPGWIDLESKYFRSNESWIGDEREGLNSYIWLIEDLNADEKVVFVSSNSDVRDGIKNSNRIYKSDVLYIYPDKSLKDEWLSRLYARWKETTVEKDWFAYKRATRSYEDSIISMENDKGFKKYVVTKENIDSFDLEKIVKEMTKE